MTPEYFTKVLRLIYEYSHTLSLEIVDSTHLKRYFKGDLDGKRIWLASVLEDEEELFNTLHLIGHSVQWNVSEELRSLGSVLHKNPDDELLKKLQIYEWEANCYALYILHQIGVFDLDKWLEDNYRLDMFYLTHFYKTGEKLKEITDISKTYEFTWALVEKVIPPFIPYANKETRDGIVIDFTGVTEKK